MRRLLLFAVGQMMLMGAAWAQQNAAVRVDASPCGWFYVDGQLYKDAATFLWATSSTHVLEPAAPAHEISTDIKCSVSQSFASSDPNDHLGRQGPQTIYVTGPRTYTLPSSLLYRIGLVLNNGSEALQFSCAGNSFGTLNGTCLEQNGFTWVPKGSVVTASVTPPAGFAFAGWFDPKFANAGSALTFIANGPTVLEPKFRAASHFTIHTNPEGMKVLVDRTTVVAPATFEWAPGTTHAVSPVSPQPTTQSGNEYAFFSWSDGGEENHTITMPDNGDYQDLTVKYAPASRVTFRTAPVGLKLSVDGSSTWPSYNFSWAVGTSHVVSAPLVQYDKSGRKYTFKKWTQGGAAEQTYKVTVGPHPDQTAVYDSAGELLIQSAANGAQVMVDGAACLLPCAVNRDPGTEVKISAPATIAVSAYERLTYTGWSDGATADRVWKATKEGAVMNVNYATSYKLVPSSSPAGGSDFTAEPASADGFYKANSYVTVTAVPKPGYTFRTWDGSTALSPSVKLRMYAPMGPVAMLDTYPYAGTVQNAVGETPVTAVAPGSVISILGVDLAPGAESGPDSPLAQALNGVMVELNGRYLSLFSVAPEKVTAQLPSNLAPGEYTLVVHQQGLADTSAKFKVARNAPGLFGEVSKEKTYAVALHEDGSAVTTESPARRGETITLLGTGFGPYRPSPVDGFAVSTDVNATAAVLVDAVQIRVGEKLVLTPAGAQAAKGFIGMTAVQLKITDALPAGSAVELRAAVKDPSDSTGKTYYESNKVLLPLQ